MELEFEKNICVNRKRSFIQGNGGGQVSFRNQCEHREMKWKVLTQKKMQVTES